MRAVAMLALHMPLKVLALLEIQPTLFTPEGFLRGRLGPDGSNGPIIFTVHALVHIS